MGLSCGSPVELANLQPGEKVLDLGSGAGVDVFRAAKIVGETGLSVGLDMTPEMLRRARANAAANGFDNVQFREGEIEAIPALDGEFDVVISNCVLNLVPDKQKAFNEIFRVLKPGGRLAVADIIASCEVPQDIREDATAYAACLGGAIPQKTYSKLLENAGFTDIRIDRVTDHKIDCTDPLTSQWKSRMSVDEVNSLFFSAHITARK